MCDPALLGVGAAACVALMSGLFVVGRRIGNWSIVDPGWASCLVLLAWTFAALSDGAPVRRAALAVAVTAWGGRHAWLLLRHRVLGHPEEGRYVELRKTWGSGAFFLFFQAQALLAVVLAGPFLLVCGHAGPGPLPLEVAALALFPMPRGPLGMVEAPELLLRVADLVRLRPRGGGGPRRRVGGLRPLALARAPALRDGDPSVGEAGAPHSRRRLPRVPAHDERVRAVASEGHAVGSARCLSRPSSPAASSPRA